jgi:hypothetical protein
LIFVVVVIVVVVDDALTPPSPSSTLSTVAVFDDDLRPNVSHHARVRTVAAPRRADADDADDDESVDDNARDDARERTVAGANEVIECVVIRRCRRGAQ